MKTDVILHFVDMFACSRSIYDEIFFEFRFQSFRYFWKVYHWIFRIWIKPLLFAHEFDTTPIKSILKCTRSSRKSTTWLKITWIHVTLRSLPVATIVIVKKIVTGFSLTSPKICFRLDLTWSVTFNWRESCPARKTDRFLSLALMGVLMNPVRIWALACSTIFSQRLLNYATVCLFLTLSVSTFNAVDLSRFSHMLIDYLHVWKLADKHTKYKHRLQLNALMLLTATFFSKFKIICLRRLWVWSISDW